jgi:hypothetical protein
MPVIGIEYESAWNKDPFFGVIGNHNLDPGDKGPHRPPVFREAEFEMLGVETIAKFRRAYFAQRMTIKAIWRALRLARKLGRKVIRSETTDFHCKREVQPQPKSSPWCDRLDPFLVDNDGKPGRVSG